MAKQVEHELHRVTGANASVEAYNRAWRLYGARCLWNVQRVDPPTPAALKATASALRTRGDRPAAQLGDLLQSIADAA
jgi:hypothetical protein